MRRVLKQARYAPHIKVGKDRYSGFRYFRIVSMVGTPQIQHRTRIIEMLLILGSQDADSSFVDKTLGVLIGPAE
jgi:hypothetical protein